MHSLFDIVKGWEVIVHCPCLLFVVQVQVSLSGDTQITKEITWAALQGDEYVHWVGMTIYHFGTSYPYGQNVLPEPREFTSTVSHIAAALSAPNRP